MPSMKYGPQLKYIAEKTSRVVMNLSHNTDSDILEKLATVQSKQGYIKRLIREDIRNAASQDSGE